VQKRKLTRLALGVLVVITVGIAVAQSGPQGWPQWGQNSEHQGFVPTIGQSPTSVLADIIYDPFTAAEERDTGGDLLVHYQVPLLDGQDVFMEFKTGRFIECVPPGSGNPPPGEADCGISAWNSQIWNQRRLHWENGVLVEKWNFQSDWKAVRIELAQWEPVYHAVLANGFVYDPGFGGSVFKLNRGDGSVVTRISPFGTPLDPNTFVAGPLSADSNGNVYYNAIKFTDQTLGAFPGLVNSWLVKIAPDDTVSMVSYPTLLASANPLTVCERNFLSSQLPWPPTPDTAPRTGPCGAQRPGLNITPAIGPDGTIYTASRGHNPGFGGGDRASYVVAVNPNLTLKWATSLAHTLNDGCGHLVPTATVPFPANPPWDLATFKGKCRFGAHDGVDPATNRPGSGRINDAGSSSPVVLPDGNVYFGAWGRYNVSRGHAYKLRGSDGTILATYDFGWDDTQAVFQHDGTYSIVMKDNHYDEEEGFYCNTLIDPATGNFIPTVSQGGDPTIKQNVICDYTNIPAGPFYITQVNPNLVPEWKFKSTETLNCHRNAGGTVSCVDDGRHPHGFEWCINAPAVDGAGNVYVESEDGNVYVLDQGHTGVFTTPMAKMFTNLAVGAAYTPYSIDMQGRTYAQNNGHLFVLGTGGSGVGQSDEGQGPHTPRRLPKDVDNN